MEHSALLTLPGGEPAPAPAPPAPPGRGRAAGEGPPRGCGRPAKALGSLAVLLACGALLVSRLVASAPRAGAARSGDTALQGEGSLSLKSFFGRMSPEALPALRRAAGLGPMSEKEIEKAEERAFIEQGTNGAGKALIEKARAASASGGAEVYMVAVPRQVQELQQLVAKTTTTAPPKGAGPPPNKTKAKVGPSQGIVADVGECAGDGESCLLSRCCTSPGTRCFRVNDWWAACNATCSAEVQQSGATSEWDCTELGPAAPEAVEEPEMPAAPDNSSNASCVESGDQCMQVRCCNDPSMQCFRMNEYWASCNATCSQRRTWNKSVRAWVDSDDPDDQWDCDVLLPHSSTSGGAGDGNRSRHGGGGGSQRRAPSPPSSQRGSEVVYMRS